MVDQGPEIREDIRGAGPELLTGGILGGVKGGSQADSGGGRLSLIQEGADLEAQVFRILARSGGQERQGLHCGFAGGSIDLRQATDQVADRGVVRQVGEHQVGGDGSNVGGVIHGQRIWIPQDFSRRKASENHRHPRTTRAPRQTIASLAVPWHNRP